MQARHRDLMNIVRAVDGLEIVDHYTTNGRAEVELRAPNGQTRKFFLSLRRGDLRTDINVKKSVQRFADENVPANPAIPVTREKIRSLKAVASTPAPAKRPTLTVPKLHDVMQESIAKPVAAPAAERALTNVEFFNLCGWVKNTDLTDYADAEAMAAAASTNFGVYVGSDVIGEVLTLLHLEEPAQWSALPDPITVLADQVAAIMTALDIKPTNDFLRLAKSLHKE